LAHLFPTVTKASPRIDRFEFERALIHEGMTYISGVDEAGRGPLAGPVVAAAVVFPRGWIQDGIPAPLKDLNDSKQLSTARREKYFAWLLGSGEIHHAIAQIDSPVIDEINILQATHRAMNEALIALDPPPQHALVDGLLVKSLRFPQTALVKGDARSYSIAAASVLAKVTRDRLMEKYDREFPDYGFAEHKGYGTARHLAALARLGPCPIHRRSFAPVREVQAEIF